MLPVTMIALACVLIAIGRQQVRKARRVEGRRWVRRAWGWGMTFAGLVVMILGVLLWGNGGVQ